ncbi:hypothetical protein KQI52_05575 [bacterium]|nr:hypothetical protein [bacterium]
MKRFSLVLAAFLLISLPFAASAQLYGPTSRDTDWSLEASVFANMTDFDLEQVNGHITDGSAYYLSQPLYFDRYDVNEFESRFTYDIRLGFNFRGLCFGAGYNPIGEESGGYTLLNASAQDVPYDFTFDGREFYAYAGYMYEFNNWLSAGPMVALGHGTISGTLVDADIGADGDELTGTYMPFRAELRGRVKLTRYVALDLGVGMRTGTVTDLEVDLGVDGVTGLPEGTNPVQDYQDTLMELDMSGMYYGGGITLLNPFGDD